MKKHHFRSGIKIFALGAFTGYPVLPDVSAPLSDGDREYREKQMIVAMVGADINYKLKVTVGAACMHGLFPFSAHTQTSVCPFWNVG